jgi:hypothetical protein
MPKSANSGSSGDIDPKNLPREDSDEAEPPSSSQEATQETLKVVVSIKWDGAPEGLSAKVTSPLYRIPTTRTLDIVSPQVLLLQQNLLNPNPRSPSRQIFTKFANGAGMKQSDFIFCFEGNVIAGTDVR